MDSELVARRVDEFSRRLQSLRHASEFNPARCIARLRQCSACLRIAAGNPPSCDFVNHARKYAFVCAFASFVRIDDRISHSW